MRAGLVFYCDNFITQYKVSGLQVMTSNRIYLMAWQYEKTISFWRVACAIVSVGPWDVSSLRMNFLSWFIGEANGDLYVGYCQLCASSIILIQVAQESFTNILCWLTSRPLYMVSKPSNFNGCFRSACNILKMVSLISLLGAATAKLSTWRRRYTGLPLNLPWCRHGSCVALVKLRVGPVNIPSIIVAHNRSSSGCPCSAWRTINTWPTVIWDLLSMPPHHTLKDASMIACSGAVGRGALRKRWLRQQRMPHNYWELQ